MPGPRKLWTGPYGAALRDRAIERASAEPSGLWLVPSPLAREQVRRALAPAVEGGRAAAGLVLGRPLAGDVRDAPRRRPARLSDAGRGRGPRRGDRAGPRDGRARRARPGRRLARLPPAAPRPDRRLDPRRAAGRRRRRRATRPVDAEEWAIFGHYRAILRRARRRGRRGVRRLGLADAARSDRRPSFAKPGQVVVIDPTAPTRAGWRLLEHCHERAQVDDRHPALRPRARPGRGLRRRRRRPADGSSTGGSSRRPIGPTASRRPAGPRRRRARAVPRRRPRPAAGSTGPAGLTILGGPRGEGVGLVVAREVRDLLDDGVAARGDPDPRPAAGTRTPSGPARRSCVVGPAGRGRGRAAGSRRSPAVSALRLAMRLPVEGWEAVDAGPAPPQRPGPLARPASARPTLRPVRGRLGDPARPGSSATGRRSGRARPRRLDRTSPGTAATAGRPSDALDRLVDAGSTRSRGPAPGRTRSTGSGGWPTSLGLGPGRRSSRSGTRSTTRAGSSTGSGRRSPRSRWTWAEFVDAGRGDSSARSRPRPPPEPGDGPARGRRRRPEGPGRRVVILANLAEGTFPTPRGRRPRRRPRTPRRRSGRTWPIRREMLRFLRVVGSAERAAGPGLSRRPTRRARSCSRPGSSTTCSAGSTTAARTACVERSRPVRPRPARPPRPGPVAGRRPGPGRGPGLRATTTSTGSGGSPARPATPRPLAGTAAALRASASAGATTAAFGPYDGRLARPGGDRRGSPREFGPDHAFSPSQLESFALCPFQFFLRYVLRLEAGRRARRARRGLRRPREPDPPTSWSRSTSRSRPEGASRRHRPARRS